MKILDRKSFMKLPSGVIYSKGCQWVFEGLSIKGDTITIDDRDIDWYYLGVEWIDAKDSDEASSRLDEMLDEGVSYPMETAYGRDGCFDYDDVFLVFERPDLERLQDYIQQALEL